MKRIAYIDWLRGLACVLMFQTHCYDSWLAPAQRHSAFFSWSQLGGTLPAPLFIFIAGISVALLTERLREKSVPARAILQKFLRRGAEIFALGLLFRVQEFALGFGHSPWTDLLRVDILNILGLSIMLLGILCWLTTGAGVSSSRRRGILAGLVAAASVALVTPQLWTVWRLPWLPWPIETYINGVHIFSQPQPWLFPLFPWSAFAFAGLAVGFFLFTDFARRAGALTFLLLAGAGLAGCAASRFFDALPVHLYSTYDYWHTSPNFFLMRCGILLLLMSLVYAWCRWGFAQKGFSPLIQLGNTSLLVYWVHIEFVYGTFSILPRRQCTILAATAGLAAIFLAMLALSVLRSRWKGRRVRASQQASSPSAALAES